MNIREHSKCQNRENCTGPGCKRKTGKTKRKGRQSREAREAEARVMTDAASVGGGRPGSWKL